MTGHGRVRFSHHSSPSITRLSPLIVQATISISYAILAESTLSFLGLGVEISTPTWGLILGGARGYFTMAWWLAIFPCLAIMVTVLSINFLGGGLRGTST